MLSSALLKLSVLVLAAPLLAPGDASAFAGPSPEGSRPDARTAPAHAFSMNLYRDGDFVSQYTPYWCIGASM